VPRRSKHPLSHGHRSLDIPEVDGIRCPGGVSIPCQPVTDPWIYQRWRGSGASVNWSQIPGYNRGGGDQVPLSTGHRSLDIPEVEGSGASVNWSQIPGYTRGGGIRCLCQPVTDPWIYQRWRDQVPLSTGHMKSCIVLNKYV
jgi:hypothetical protein